MLDYNDIKIEPIPKSLQLIDISDKEYFSSEYDDFISNSSMKLINPAEGGSIEKYLQGIQFSANDSFLIGNAIHELLLQPNEFTIAFNVDRPTAKAGYMADELYTKWLNGQLNTAAIRQASSHIGYYVDSLNDSKINKLLDKCVPYFEQRKDYESNYTDTASTIYLSKNYQAVVNTCIANLAQYKPIQELLKPAYIITPVKTFNEMTILLDIKCTNPSNEERILHLKGKLDNFTVDYDMSTITLNDVKTSLHSPDEFGHTSFYKYHYYRQMAFYLWFLKFANDRVFKIPDVQYKANMLLVSTVDPYDCGVYSVNNKQIKRGFDEFAELLKRIACIYYE